MSYKSYRYRVAGRTGPCRPPCRKGAWEPSVSTNHCSVLIVDDEPYILPTLASLVGREFEVETANSADAAEEVLARRPIDIVLTDQRMPRRTGVQLLEWV